MNELEEDAGPLRVVIADDHAPMRGAVRRALDTDPSRIEFAGEAADGEQATALIASLLPDVALVDLRMPKLDGIEVATWVSGHAPPLPTRVLVLSAFHDAQLVLRALRAGATGYVDKGASPAELCEAVRAAAAGRFAFTARTLGAARPGTLSDAVRATSIAAAPQSEVFTTTEPRLGWSTTARTGSGR